MKCHAFVQQIADNRAAQRRFANLIVLEIILYRSNDDDDDDITKQIWTAHFGQWCHLYAPWFTPYSSGNMMVSGVIFSIGQYDVNRCCYLRQEGYVFSCVFVFTGLLKN